MAFRLSAPMSNKAHTATVNRIAQRYGVRPDVNAPFDIQAEDFIIEVETSASLDDAVQKLRNQSGAVYIAVTNKEGIDLAVKKTQGTFIGIMDPKGNVVQPSGGHSFPDG